MGRQKKAVDVSSSSQIVQPEDQEHTSKSPSKKSPKDSDAANGLDALLAFEEELGDDTTAFKRSKKDMNIIAMPSPLFNDLCVIGGLPRGRIVQFYGPFGGGKTFLAMLAAKSALEADPKAVVIWFDAETSFNYEWAEVLGIWFSNLCTTVNGKIVDKNRLRVYPINDGKDIFRRISGEKKINAYGKETKKPGLLDMIKAGTLRCPLIVLDSIAAIIPAGEDTSAIGKQNMALLPRFLPTEFRRLSIPLANADVCLLCINQVTTNIGDNWGDKFTFSGGEKLKHWLSLNIFIDKINAKEGKILTEKDNLESSIGQEIKFVVKKSKYGPYPRSCSSRLCFKGGVEYTGTVYDKIGVVDLEYEWIELGKHYGVITGGTWLSFNDNKYCGNANFANALKENEELLKSLKKEIETVKSNGAINNMHLQDEEDIISSLDQFEEQFTQEDSDTEE